MTDAPCASEVQFQTTQSATDYRHYTYAQCIVHTEYLRSAQSRTLPAPIIARYVEVAHGRNVQGIATQVQVRQPEENRRG